jgi:hypothetical protein
MASETNPDIFADLVAALSELTNPPKDATAQYGRYTSLPVLLDHIRPVLAAHGLGLIQEARSDILEGVPVVGVQTSLQHRSGAAYDAGTLLLPAGPNAQTSGSAMTYARRYAIQALLGIAGDTDDDGASAAGKADVRPSLRQPRSDGVTEQPKADALTSPASAGQGREDAAVRVDPAADSSAPTLPIGDGPPNWQLIANRLSKAWGRTVTMTDAKQAVIQQLRKEDIPAKSPRDVNEDLAHHALQGLERLERRTP